MTREQRIALARLPFVLLLYALMAPVILLGIIWLVSKISFSIGEDAGVRLIDLICGTDRLTKK